MSKVVEEFRIRQYAVLKLDKMPQVHYKKYRIGTEEFEPVPIYDLPQCIAITSDKSYLGETVEFI
ncbi:MAG: hypothetical protein ACLU6W_11535 [Lachnospiraceae bacterium]